MNYDVQFRKEALMQVLLEKTRIIIKMLTGGIYQGEEYNKCKQSILKLQEEINMLESDKTADDGPTPFLSPDRSADTSPGAR